MFLILENLKQNFSIAHLRFYAIQGLSYAWKVLKLSDPDASGFFY